MEGLVVSVPFCVGLYVFLKHMLQMTEILHLQISDAMRSKKKFNLAGSIWCSRKLLPQAFGAEKDP